MPNWCHNNLRVDADDMTIEKIKSTITNEKGEFTFEKFLPTPKELLNTQKHFALKGEKPNMDLIKKYGADNWYDWRHDNWGVKWDASDAVMEGQYDEIRGEYLRNGNLAQFKTPWGPPTEFFKNLSKEFPTARFILQFSDEFVSSEPLGEISYKAGKATQLQYFDDDEYAEMDRTYAAEDIWDGVWVQNWANRKRNPKGW